MKIVISSDIYYPMINGVAVFSRSLAAGLHQRGHEVLVLSPSITGKFSIEKDKEYWNETELINYDFAPEIKLGIFKKIFSKLTFFMMQMVIK